MGDKTPISWTDATWNPLAGCSIISPGCKNCYAMRQAHRLAERFAHAKYQGLTKVVNGNPVWTGEVRLWEEALDQPARWQRPRLIFVNSMSDLGHEALDDSERNTVVYVMANADQHLYQVLTKRADVLARYLLDPEGLPSGLLKGQLDHVLWGVSVEDQRRADERREAMRAIAAAGFRVWVSYEPALGPVDWSGWDFLSGMVSGGESGPGHRGTDMAWHRTARDWCAANSVAYDFKQVGGATSKSGGDLLDGERHTGFTDWCRSLLPQAGRA